MLLLHLVFQKIMVATLYFTSTVSAFGYRCHDRHWWCMNASIIAEAINWGNMHLYATGLGAYIAYNTRIGNSINMALGIVVMCFYVLLINRIFGSRSIIFHNDGAEIRMIFMATKAPIIVLENVSF